MRAVALLRWIAGTLALLAAGSIAAASLVVTFPEVNGPANASGPFPAPPLTIGPRTFTIPGGDRVVSATISGSWGSSLDPNSTSGVTVLLDGFTVATCVKPDPNCWTGQVGPRAWTHVLTDSEKLQLNDGQATLTAVQTSDLAIRMGVTTLLIETAPSIVPALSPLGLALLLVAMAAAGALAVRRYARG
jgi:hypothetical protein